MKTENADVPVGIWKLLPEKGKRLIKWVKKDDIYIDYPVISYSMEMYG